MLTTISNHLDSNVLVRGGSYRGGVSGMVQEWKKKRIMDHQYKNFVFANHEISR